MGRSENSNSTKLSVKNSKFCVTKILKNPMDDMKHQKCNAKWFGLIFFSACAKKDWKVKYSYKILINVIFGWIFCVFCMLLPWLKGFIDDCLKNQQKHFPEILNPKRNNFLFRWQNFWNFPTRNFEMKSSSKLK